MRSRSWLGALLALSLAGGPLAAESDSGSQAPATWRRQHRLIDLHQHLDYTPATLARAIQVMDAVGIGLGVDLTPGTVTRGVNGAPSEFEQHKAMEDRLFPGRWVQYMNLDYRDWDQADFAARAVKQVEEGYRLGAAGFKEWKRLGLYLRDGRGELIKVDDPKLDPMWERLGQLNMPVSIHVADPKAFFEPYNEHNERWQELKDHRNWWFGDTNRFPTFQEILDALGRVIARHPHTTFVCVHFGNNAEDLAWVESSLERYPNMLVDLAARIPELGRHPPNRVHRLFSRFQDRILFGTDFQSLESRMILGSSGNEPPPSIADAEVFFFKEYRWLETWDRNWAHMTPIQGNWTISSIGLSPEVLRKIYFDNARRLLARSLPLPAVRARRTTRDFEPDGDLTKEIWQRTLPVFLDRQSRDGRARPEVATTVRVLWSPQFLYIGYQCPYTRLTTFTPPQLQGERAYLANDSASLWSRDVVEAFIAPNPQNPAQYAEFEVAPTNERLDLRVNPTGKDVPWSSGFSSAVGSLKGQKAWTCEMRIPLAALSRTVPEAGSRWRLNLFRCDRANHAALAWNPTLEGSFHAPQRFGELEFTE